MTVAITPEVLADLRKKAEESTCCEWTTHPVNVGTAMHPDFIIGVVAGESGSVLWDPQEMHERDKAFIAAANPAVVLALLDRIEALEAEIEESTNAAIERGERD